MQFVAETMSCEGNELCIAVFLFKVLLVKDVHKGSGIVSKGRQLYLSVME